MLLTIDGSMRVFVPLRAFRAEFELPSDFNTSLFTHRPAAPRRTLVHAGSALRQIKQAVLDAIPTDPATTWTLEAIKLESVFRRELIRHCAVLGMSEREIDGAALGFGAVCEAFVYTTLRAQSEGAPLPYFPNVYLDWLDSTVAISTTMFPYEADGNIWQVQLLRTAYGISGMIVHTAYGTHYVQDATHSCPAEDFMIELLEAVTRRFAAAMSHSEPAELVLHPF